MTDLTKITTPFGLLDHETKRALRYCGGPWDVFLLNGVWAKSETPTWSPGFTYRQAPQPVTYPKIPWEAVDEKWLFWARDNDGVGCFYSAKPKIRNNRWLSTLGDTVGPGILKLDPGTCDWRDSLVERPK